MLTERQKERQTHPKAYLSGGGHKCKQSYFEDNANNCQLVVILNTLLLDNTNNSRCVYFHVSDL